MVRLIAHRGNIGGPSELENTPQAIINSLSYGFDCEVDVHFEDNHWWLGHNGPEYHTTLAFLYQWAPNLWIHAKTPRTFHELHRHRHVLNYFWHDIDRLAMTSLGYSWTCDPSSLSPMTVYMCADNSWRDSEIHTYAICSDYLPYASRTRSNRFTALLRKGISLI